MENNEDIVIAVSKSSDNLQTALNSFYKKTAEIFAGTVLTDFRGSRIDFETREIPLALSQQIESALEIEGVILSELSLINKTTIESIFEAIVDGENEGKSINEVQQAIIDAGIFSPSRALRIARTVAGTAQSIGQIEGAKSVGATHKVWNDSNFEVREEHKNRDGEKVAMTGVFSSQFSGFKSPRYPLDQGIAPADRINCRCSMTFSIEN